MSAIKPTNPNILTTQQAFHAMLARHALESEPRQAFDLAGTNIICTNNDAMPGQRNYSVIFTPKDSSLPYQIFDGRNWDNFPA